MSQHRQLYAQLQADLERERDQVLMERAASAMDVLLYLMAAALAAGAAVMVWAPGLFA